MNNRRAAESPAPQRTSKAGKTRRPGHAGKRTRSRPRSKAPDGLPKSTAARLALSVSSFEQRCRAAARDILVFKNLADSLDGHPPGFQAPPRSESKRMALLRERVEKALCDLSDILAACVRQRLPHSWSPHFLLRTFYGARGDCDDALLAMRHYEDLALKGAPIDPRFPPRRLLADFAWEAYQRVVHLGPLAEANPKALHRRARFMRGWPMLVSNQVDTLGEFDRIAAAVGLGANHVLDDRPRHRRRAEGGLYHYLVGLLEALEWVRQSLPLVELRQSGRCQIKSPLPQKFLPSAKTPAEFIAGLHYLGRPFPDDTKAPAVRALLERLRDLPPLHAASLPRWVEDILVPFIICGDAATPETCVIDPLRALWRQRGVKSPAIFKSRLRTAVLQSLRPHIREAQAESLRT